MSRQIVVKARAYAKDKAPSDVVTAVYTVLDKCIMPIILPEDGMPHVIGDTGTVVIQKMGSPYVRYTLDGSDPTRSSLEYTDPILLYKHATVKAIAQEDGKRDSDIAVREMFLKVSTPAIGVDGDVEFHCEEPVISWTRQGEDMVEISITCPTQGAYIVYTLDGTDPSF